MRVESDLALHWCRASRPMFGFCLLLKQSVRLSSLRSEDMSDKQVVDVHRKAGHRKHSKHSSGVRPSSDRHSHSDSKNSDKHDRNADRRRRRGEDRSSDRSKHKDNRSHRRSQRKDERPKRRRSRDNGRSRSRSRDRDSQSKSRRREKSPEKPSRDKSEPVVDNANKEEESVKEMIEMSTREANSQPTKDTIHAIKVPNYYNPGAVNPIKFVETQKKRKMLWSREDNETQEKKSLSTSTSNPWSQLKFGGEKGSEMTEKFRKLMGIKESDGSTANHLPKNKERTESAIKSQETLFKNLDQQYSNARMATHTQRGFGLGFGSRGDK